jgi:hypothetical protein
MKILLFLVVCFIITAGVAQAQSPGSIGIYDRSDGLGHCLNNESDLLLAYVVHGYAPGVTSCRFAVEVTGAELTYIGFYSDFTCTGNPIDGVTVDYGICLVSPIYVMRIIYTGVSDPCDLICVVDDPRTPPVGVYSTDCYSNEMSAGHECNRINVDGIQCRCTVPVEETTWGKVKALYR